MGKKNSKIAPETMSDLKKETEFTENEIHDWYTSFLNDCPDGKLNLEDFKLTYSSFFPDGDASAFSENVFKTFDINGDGYIDFKEFVTALSITTRGTIEQKLNWAFNMYDIDGNGNITKDEMLKIVKSLYKMTGDAVERPADEATPELRVQKVFRALDKNDDDKLTREEFIEGAKNDPVFADLLQASPTS